MGRYQYKREPLSADEANRLANACTTHLERLVIWTLLDTGLRVSERAGLRRVQIDWQNHRMTIYGKGGPFVVLPRGQAPRVEVVTPDTGAGGDSRAPDADDARYSTRSTAAPLAAPRRSSERR